MAAIVVGVALLTGLALVQGMLGQRTGAPLAALTAGPLGREGSRLTASVVMLAMMLGWFGVNAGVAGVALARLAGIPDVAGVILLTVVMLGIVALGLVGAVVVGAGRRDRDRRRSPPTACTSPSPTTTPRSRGATRPPTRSGSCPP